MIFIEVHFKNYNTNIFRIYTQYNADKVLINYHSYTNYNRNFLLLHIIIFCMFQFTLAHNSDFPYVKCNYI